MLEVSDVATKIESIINQNVQGVVFKIYTDAGELEADIGQKPGTESYVCGLLELFSNSLSGEGLRFQDLTFQITWFCDGRKTRVNGKKIAKQVGDIRKILTNFAENYNNKNNTAEAFGGDFFSTTYLVKLPETQTEIKNWGYFLSCVPMTQIIEMVLIENGFSSNQWNIKVNGEKLTLQTVTLTNEKQANHNLISNEKRTKGVIVSGGFCLDAVIPQLTTAFCDLVEDDVLDYKEDKAICLYIKGHTKENIYICTLGSDSISLQPGTNAGINIALVEGVEDLLTFDNNWVSQTISVTANESVSLNATGHIFWGDGGKTIGANYEKNGATSHTFEEAGSYTIRVFGTITTITENETEIEEQ